MLIEEFMNLELSERAELLAKQGLFLTSRTARSFQVQLYQLDDFYVEIWNNTIHGMLMQIHAFNDKSFLKPYLDEMDLKEF